MRTNRLTHIEVLEIVRRYPNELAETIAADFNVHVTTVYKIAQRYKVHKSEEFRNSQLSGRIVKGERRSTTTEFQKGMKPWSHGKKLKYKPGHLWQKGNKPHNTGTDGEIRWRSNPGFYFIRISEGNWEFLHRYLWQQQNGAIPKGYNVVFNDGNKRNCAVENLECITDAQLVARNSIVRYPSELRKLIHIKSKLKKAVING